MLLFIGSLTYAAFSQTISPSHPPTSLVCPGEIVSYTFLPPSGSAFCSVLWSFSGSYSFLSGNSNSSNPVYLKWNDNASNKVTVTGVGRYRCTAQGCTCSAAERANVTTTNYLKTVSFQNLTGVVTPREIPFCESNPTVIVTIDKLQIKNTGGINQPKIAYADRYVWTIPTGWRQAGTGTPGTVYTADPTIQIQPANPNGICSPSGTLKVNAIAGGTPGCLNTSISNPGNIQLSRTPAFSLTPPIPGYEQKCGARQAVTFTATSVSCATKYLWTYPPGWTGPPETTTNYTFVGPADVQGNVTVTAVTPTCNLSASYFVQYSTVVPTPNISNTGGTYEWCNYESFSFTSNVPWGYLSNFGFDWYGTGGILINGVAATFANPLHTTSNVATITIPGGTYGQHSIGVRMNNLVCTPSAWNGYTKKVGPYSNSEFSIIGPSNVCPNQAADFRSNFITSDLTGFQWSAPPGWSSSGQGTPYFSVSVPSPFYGGAITLRLQNRCGITNTPYVLNLSPGGGCGFSFSLSPNPSSATLTISGLDEVNGSTVTLKDKNGKTIKEVKTKEPKIEIDVSDVPNGIYILVVTQKSETETEQIVINH